MPDPGATTSGFNRPSWVGPLDELLGMSLAKDPFNVEPTPMTFFADDSELAEPGPPILWTAKTTVMSGLSRTKASSCMESSVYFAKSSGPLRDQLSVWIHE